MNACQLYMLAQLETHSSTPNLLATTCIKVLMAFIDPECITPGDVTTYKESNKLL